MTTKPTKITDARIEELEKLRDRRDKLKEKIEKMKDKMKEISDGMERGGTTEVILSSSTVARGKRGIVVSTESNTDVLKIMEMAIIRLEETYAKAVEELEGLKEPMSPA